VGLPSSVHPCTARNSKQRVLRDLASCSVQWGWGRRPARGQQGRPTPFPFNGSGASGDKKPSSGPPMDDPFSGTPPAASSPNPRPPSLTPLSPSLCHPLGATLQSPPQPSPSRQGSFEGWARQASSRSPRQPPEPKPKPAAAPTPSREDSSRGEQQGRGQRLRERKGNPQGAQERPAQQLRQRDGPGRHTGGSRRGPPSRRSSAALEDGPPAAPRPRPRGPRP